MVKADALRASGEIRVGSNPTPSNRSPLAQWIVHSPSKREVVGSSPTWAILVLYRNHFREKFIPRKCFFTFKVHFCYTIVTLNIKESCCANYIRPPRFHYKNECISLQLINRMEQPQTRREKKKDQHEKGQGKNGKYSAKHIRNIEKLTEKKI